jgi:hypothetical protein
MVTNSDFSLRPGISFTYPVKVTEKLLKFFAQMLYFITVMTFGSSVTFFCAFPPMTTQNFKPFVAPRNNVPTFDASRDDGDRGKG